MNNFNLAIYKTFSCYNQPIMRPPFVPAKTLSQKQLHFSKNCLIFGFYESEIFKGKENSILIYHHAPSSSTPSGYKVYSFKHLYNEVTIGYCSVNLNDELQNVRNIKDHTIFPFHINFKYHHLNPYKQKYLSLYIEGNDTLKIEKYKKRTKD